MTPDSGGSREPRAVLSEGGVGEWGSEEGAPGSDGHGSGTWTCCLGLPTSVRASGRWV